MVGGFFLPSSFPIIHRQIEATQRQTQKILMAHWPSLQPKHAEQNYTL